MVNARRFPDLPRAGKPTIGVLALQGSFPLHIARLQRCGVATRRVRKPEDLADIQGLVIPGGESTTMENLASRCGLFDALRSVGRNGLPIFGTCAGAILLGRGSERPERLQLVDLEVRRNAYGRQVDSFNAELSLASFETPFHGVFIRAPIIEAGAENLDCEILGRHEGHPVLIRNGRILLATFHPELTDDLRIHKLFLEMCELESGKAGEEIREESGAGQARENAF